MRDLLSDLSNYDQQTSGMRPIW